MFKPGDKVRIRHSQTVSEVLTTSVRKLWFTDGSEGHPANYELAEPTLTVTHIRTLCEKMRTVAGPQGRFWIREVFERATGEKL